MKNKRKKKPLAYKIGGNRPGRSVYLLFGLSVLQSTHHTGQPGAEDGRAAAAAAGSPGRAGKHK